MKPPIINCSVYLGILFSLANIQATQAQIVPDNTLPNNSTVSPQGNILQIQGGTTRGNNLFHSFEAFSIPPDLKASFDNAAQIQHIFSRVTGNSISNIEGILETQGTADLFLINPNGIIFGKNASLNIGGSFFATTAETILFEDNTQFSAVDADNPPLLTVTAPIGLNLGTNPGDIINRSFAFDEGLVIQPGNTIGLIGGNVSVESGNIIANGGRIEIGAVSANNNLSLISDELGWKVDYQNVTEFQDINFDFAFISSDSEIGGQFIFTGRDLNFINESFISLGSDSGGNIEIQGTNIIFDKGSQIVAGAFVDEAVNITIRGSESVVVGSGENGVSGIFNDVYESASGEKGQILSIETKNLILRDGGQIATATSGSGKGVDLQVNASESITIEGIDLESEPSSSSILSRALQKATGDAGKLTINTPNLIIRDGGQISGSTESQGNGADINIISNSIFLEGRNSLTNFTSGIFAQTSNIESIETLGNAGNIKIDTDRLSIFDGAQISTAIFKSGNTGKITINSSDSIVVNGTSPLGKLVTSLSGIFTTAQSESIGNVGSVSIKTPKLIVEQGGVISANNRGIGEGGSIDIDVGKLILREGGQIGAGSLVFNAAIENPTKNRGSGGTLNINARESIEVSGKASIRDEIFKSSIFTRAEGTGDAGNLVINTSFLTVSDEGEISASTLDSGVGGEIKIITQKLDVENRGNITAQALGEGNAGDIILEVGDNITLTGDKSGIFANTASDSEGDGGSILTQNKTPQKIVVRDGAEIAVNSEGRGEGGRIELEANELTLNDGSITAETAINQGGNITLNVDNILTFENSGKVTATAGTAPGRGDGGNVTINSDFILAYPTDNNYQITARASQGNGGDIQITTDSFFGREFVNLDASSNAGIDGNVSVEILEVDPARGLTELPNVPVDVAALLAQNLCEIDNGEDGETSSFINIGRGGLPPNPYKPLDSNDDIFVDVQLPTEWREKNTENSSVSSQITEPIVEANTLIINEKGNVELVAKMPSKNLRCR